MTFSLVPFNSAQFGLVSCLAKSIIAKLSLSYITVSNNVVGVCNYEIVVSDIVVCGTAINDVVVGGVIVRDAVVNDVVRGAPRL